MKVVPLTADKAREITDKACSFETTMGRVYDKILQEVIAGNSYLYLRLNDSFLHYFRESIVKTLKDHGYEVDEGVYWIEIRW